MREDFAVFILCHGNPDRVLTWESLDRCKYQGKRYIILDDEDKTIEGYQNRFGKDRCLIFSKEEYAKKVDAMDNLNYRKCAVFARNACYDLAKQVGVKYFCQIDDDMVDIAYRTVINGEVKRTRCYSVDSLFDALITFLDTNPNFYSVAIAQPGDYVGGINSGAIKKKYWRKTMNFWMCDVDKPLRFNGTLNDDVNTFTYNGTQGKIFLTVPGIMQDQPQTQSTGGGMADAYTVMNTYNKSFRTVMLCPSCVKVAAFHNSVYPRIHHKIYTENAYPKIISDRFKIQ